MKQIILLCAIFATAMCGMINDADMMPQPYFEVQTDVTFDLYTMKNPLDPQTLTLNDTQSFDSSNFNSSIPTRILCHGFQSKGEITYNFIDAYFIRGRFEVNMIAVNWEKSSQTLNYYNAATKYVQQIGVHTAKFIDFMVINKLVKLSDVTVIGFSLGAHIAGYAGKNVQTGQLPKIVGLDPAWPLFSHSKPEARLHSEDAVYVETVHTSKLGFFKPLGLVSFYPNGGRFQPGCTWDITGKCSHQTAYKYFVESIITKEPIYGYSCESLDAIHEGNCTTDGQQIILGGEPGAKKQPPGLYYINITLSHEKLMADLDW